MAQPVLLVGLGNPGPRYASTPHNVGFMLVDKLVDHFKARPEKISVDGEVYSFMWGDAKTWLLKPHTFMNLSGKAILSLCSKKSFDISDVLVIHDDVDLEFGRIKLKNGGGSGGHNGIKSIMGCMGPAFWRLRLGIGRGPLGTAEHVLRSQPSSSYTELLDRGMVAVDLIREKGSALAMNTVNAQKAEK